MKNLAEAFEKSGIPFTRITLTKKQTEDMDKRFKELMKSPLFKEEDPHNPRIPNNIRFC